MKMTTVLKESLRLYRKNWAGLMLALLLEVVIRAMCLTPLLFLASEGTKWGALLCIPLYILIALPARQNYAEALQDMIAGGSVFTPRLVSFENYGRKLLRGLEGMGRIAAWCVLPAAAAVLMYKAATEMDVLTLLRQVMIWGGGDIMTGGVKVLLAFAATLLLPVIGCAVYCGVRHACALGSRKLLRGNRLKLMLMWLASLVILLPTLVLAAVPVLNFVKGALDALSQMALDNIPGISLTNGYLIAAVVTLIPALPLKNMLPAVYLAGVKEKQA